MNIQELPVLYPAKPKSRDFGRCNFLAMKNWTGLPFCKTFLVVVVPQIRVIQLCQVASTPIRTSVLPRTLLGFHNKSKFFEFEM